MEPSPPAQAGTEQPPAQPPVPAGPAGLPPALARAWSQAPPLALPARSWSRELALRPAGRRQLTAALTAGVVVLLALALVTWRLVVLDQHQAADRRDLASAVAAAERRAAAQGERVDGLEARLRAVESRVQAQADPVKIARLVQQSVFTVESARGQGSAFVIASDESSATLVTNYHVIAGSSEVVLRRDGVRLAGQVDRVDLGADLATIAVERPLPALARATSAPAVGDPVVSVGSPLGLGGTVTTGVVSALRAHQIQFSAPVSPGNSGGPLVDRGGRVIGVTVAKYVAAGAEGLSLAVPIEAVCARVLDCS